MRKIISIVLSFGLLFQQSGLLYAAGQLNLANYLSQARNAIVQPDVFQPARLRYISYDMANNDFKLLLDKGNAKLNDATPELFNYFLIGLALPNDTFWVNLRPDAPENIIDPILEKTDIGKIFLEADLQLKKDTASLTSPQNPEGKLYWDKLYKKAGELFGTENITIPTITRPWIVPNEVIVRETEDSAYIYKATLKVMLEADYLNGRGGSRTAPTPDQYAFSDPRLKELNEYSSQIIREIIIPKLTKEVNSSKRYAQLRQVYYSLVLSRWFKQKYSSLGSTRAQGASAPANSYISLINSGDLANLASKESYDKQTYFQAYQKSFKDGEYNLKETVATPFGQSIRSYVSGGISVVGSPIMPGKISVSNSSPVVNDAITNNSPEQPATTTASPVTPREIKNKAIEALRDANLHFGYYRRNSYYGFTSEKWIDAADDNSGEDIVKRLEAEISHLNVVIQKEKKGDNGVVYGEAIRIKNIFKGLVKQLKNDGKKESGSPLTVEAMIERAREILNELHQFDMEIGAYYKELLLKQKEKDALVRFIENDILTEIGPLAEEVDEEAKKKKEPYLVQRAKQLLKVKTKLEELITDWKTKRMGDKASVGSPLTCLRDFLDALESHSKSHRDSDSIKPYYNDAISMLINTIKQQIELISEGKYHPVTREAGKSIIEGDWKYLCSQMPGIEKTLVTKYNDVIKALASYSKVAGSPLGVALPGVNGENGEPLRYISTEDLIKIGKLESLRSAVAQMTFSADEASKVDKNRRFAVEIDRQGTITVWGILIYNEETQAVSRIILPNGLSDLKLTEEKNKNLNDALIQAWKEEVRINTTYAGSPVVGKKLLGSYDEEIGRYLSPNDLGNNQLKKLLDLVKAKYFPALIIKKSDILGIGANGNEILNSLLDEYFLKEIRLTDELLIVNKKKTPIGMLRMLRRIIKSDEDLKKVFGVLKPFISGAKAIPIIEPSHLREMRFAVKIEGNEWELLGVLQLNKDKKVEDIMGDDKEIIFALDKACKKELGVSSAVALGQVHQETGQWGGIDLTDRALHIKLERVGSFASTPLLLPQVKNAQDLDLDKEFEQVEALASSGIVPNSHRLLELFTICHYRGEFGERLNQIISCLKAASAIQEAQAIDSDEDFRLALMMPEMLS